MTNTCKTLLSKHNSLADPRVEIIAKRSPASGTVQSKEVLRENSR
jgi:hypothetical protein